MSPHAVDPSAPIDGLLQHLPRPVFTGGNEVSVLQGGDELFPALCARIAQARHEVWLATYIFHLDPSTHGVCHALVAAARRGVRVRVVVDGFGSWAGLQDLQALFAGSGVALAVFRPLHRWWNWLQPAQLRRLHQKLCVVDGDWASVGGINVLDDRLDLTHGWGEHPRLDFALAVRGPVVQSVEQCARAVWTRAWLGQEVGEELLALAHNPTPWARLRRVLRRLRLPRGNGFNAHDGDLPPVQAAFVLRDNLRQRRTIERAYIAAIQGATARVDLVTPYFYPGYGFRRALRLAARRGVRVRLLLQGKVDYQIAAFAAGVLYDELLSQGVQIYEYTQAFLHAKVALVDEEWATVGSSNIDPLSLLLNLEANVIVRDAGVVRELSSKFEAALAHSRRVSLHRQAQGGLWRKLSRTLVRWAARLYLRVAGATGRY
jgi:cardiolipin synthase